MFFQYSSFRLWTKGYDHGVDSGDDHHHDIIGGEVDHNDHHNDDRDYDVKEVNGS